MRCFTCDLAVLRRKVREANASDEPRSLENLTAIADAAEHVVAAVDAGHEHDKAAAV